MIHKFRFKNSLLIIFMLIFLMGCKKNILSENSNIINTEINFNENYNKIWKNSSQNDFNYESKIRFYNNLRYIIEDKQKDYKIYYFGSWVILNNNLKTTVEEVIILYNDGVLEKENLFPKENIIYEGKNYQYIKFAKNEKQIDYEISSMYSDKTLKNSRDMIFIDGKQFWAFENNEDNINSFYNLKNEILNSNILNTKTEIINKEELFLLDEFGLYLSKNEIFARYGFDFSVEKLENYFNNVIWYEEIENSHIDLENVTEVEKINFTNINNKYKEFSFGSSKWLDTFREVNQNNIDKKILEKTIYKDINNDYLKEEINIIFTLNKINENFVCQQLEIKINNSIYKKTADLIYSNIYFMDFNICDSTTQFYFVEEDNLGNKKTTILSYEENNIIENLILDSTIEFYDRKNKIYTNLNYTEDINKTINSYYTLEGLVTVDKNNLIGKELSFNKSLILLNEPIFNFNFIYEGENFFNPSLLNFPKEYENSIVGFGEKNSKLIIEEIIFIKERENEIPEPWIKVLTENNLSGWFRFKR